jgi:hypothetical protein
MLPGTKTTVARESTRRTDWRAVGTVGGQFGQMFAVLDALPSLCYSR